MNSINYITSVQTEYFPGEHPALWVRVFANVENMVLERRQTMEEPEEWGPADCYMEFTIYDYENDVTMNEKSIMELIEHYGDGWKICEDGLDT